MKTYCKKEFLVAPHAGAWIETSRLYTYLLFILSRLMRARGLKHTAAGDTFMANASRLMRARGLKLITANA